MNGMRDQSRGPSLRWRLGNRALNRVLINCSFRYIGAERLAAGVLDRFAPVGIPRADGRGVLRRVRSWAGWPEAWEALATHCLALRPASVVTREDAVQWRDLSREAALALHAAQLLVMEAAAKRALHCHAASLYREVAARLDPVATPVTLTFRGIPVPGYLSLPPAARGSRAAPLVVFLNGGSTAKEELNGWRDPFLAAGFATLALDNPGTGESWGVVGYVPNQRALLDALRQMTAAHPSLDGRIALLGVSLGGMLAVHLAAEAPDLAAVVAITSPFAPGEYITAMAPLSQWEVGHVTGYPSDCLPYLCRAVSLAPCAPRLFMPTLVVGAGRDWIVPPAESRRLYASTVAPRTLHWYPRASHCCFSHLDVMLADTVRWLVRHVPPRG